uniref:Interleukin 18 n=1 Tax=Laticauda laticaudata TaxID=8630 RepID=A0A8C5SV83_LATLA
HIYTSKLDCVVSLSHNICGYMYNFVFIYLLILSCLCSVYWRWRLFEISGIKFDIHSYQDTKPKGLCVAFTVEFNHQIYHMCVEKKENKMRVNFKEGTIPKNIEGDTSNIIFIKTQFSGGSRQFYKFESALERGYFLAFECVKGSSETVLVVKKVEPADEVDESTKLHHATLL